MNVHRHAEAARLARDVAEEEILERFVFGTRRLTAGDVSRVHAARGLGGRIVEVERTEIGRLELHRHAAALPLTLERRCHHCAQIGVERRWQGRDIQVCEVTAQELFLERVELAGVGGCRGFGFRGEREHQRIYVGHPAKTRLREPRAHGDPVCEHYLRADAVEHPRGKPVALLFGDTLPRATQLDHVRLVEIGVRVAVERAIGGEPVRALRPEPHREREGQQ
jgi:hypothetical protein